LNLDLELPTVLNASRRLEISGANDRPTPACRVPALVAIERVEQPLLGLICGPAPDVEVAWWAPDGTRWWGLGAAFRLETRLAQEARSLPDRARALLEEVATDPEARALLRCFGGVAFDPARPGAWPAAAFWLPACLVQADPSGVRLAVTTWRQPEESDAALAMRHAEALQLYRVRVCTAPAPVSWVGGQVRPAGKRRERWDAGVEAALAAIATGTFEKVVLAHGPRLDFATPPDLARAFESLGAKAPGTDRFCLRPRQGLAMLAASPEVLFDQAGEKLAVDCLAGTAPRGEGEQADQRHADALLASIKERHEHEVVVAFVREALVPHVVSLDVPRVPGLRRLATLQHLHTAVTAQIVADTPLAQWFDALHPTPAVCGQPREASRQFVQAHEEGSRGWYAGALGWVGVEAARFVVGLRAALVEDASAWVPAGAGIVTGSTPANEWAETERKAAPMQGLLSGEMP
jgi:isochorismate synthase